MIGCAPHRAVTICRTVGLAYVGSNPTPATTCDLDQGERERAVASGAKPISTCEQQKMLRQQAAALGVKLDLRSAPAPGGSAVLNMQQRVPGQSGHALLFCPLAWYGLRPCRVSPG